MATQFMEYYAAHVAEMQSRWETALEAENLQAVLVHSGTPLSMHSGPIPIFWPGCR